MIFLTTFPSELRLQCSMFPSITMSPPLFICLNLPRLFPNPLNRIPQEQLNYRHLCKLACRLWRRGFEGDCAKSKFGSLSIENGGALIQFFCLFFCLLFKKRNWLAPHESLTIDLSWHSITFSSNRLATSTLFIWYTVISQCFSLRMTRNVKEIKHSKRHTDRLIRLHSPLDQSISVRRLEADDRAREVQKSEKRWK